MEQRYQKRGYLQGAFRLFHMKDAPEERVEYHYHDFYKLLIVLSGTGGYWIDGERYQLTGGDVVLLDRHLPHRPEFETEYERVIIYIAPEFLQGCSTADCDLQQCFSLREQNVVRLPPQECQRVFSLVRQLEEELSSREAGKDILSKGLLLQLLVELYRMTRGGSFSAVLPLVPRDERINGILRYMDEHLFEEIRIDTLAKQFFLSRYHMMRLFRENTGFTIHAYLVDRRLASAREMIAKGVGATEACYKTGFNSYCTFCRAYHKRFGMSPTGRLDPALRVEESYE